MAAVQQTAHHTKADFSWTKFKSPEVHADCGRFISAEAAQKNRSELSKSAHDHYTQRQRAGTPVNRGAHMVMRTLLEFPA
jgi:hypothetical protein